MIRKQHILKPLYGYVNHTAEVRTLSVRDQYRVYLAEQEAYGFYPISFRAWYSWYEARERISSYLERKEGV